MKQNDPATDHFPCTLLTDGSPVSRADSRVEAYGTLDELNSFTGWLLPAAD